MGRRSAQPRTARIIEALSYRWYWRTRGARHTSDHRRDCGRLAQQRV